MGWPAVKNGELLVLAEKNFDVFVTVDRNLSFRQHLPDFSIAVIVLRARSNRLQDPRALFPSPLAHIEIAERSAVTYAGTESQPPVRVILEWRLLTGPIPCHRDRNG